MNLKKSLPKKTEKIDDVPIPKSKHYSFKRIGNAYTFSIPLKPKLTLNCKLRASDLCYELKQVWYRNADYGSDGTKFTATISLSKKAKITDAAQKTITLLDTFHEHPLKPLMVEEIMGISSSERLKWTKEKKLPICGYESFKKSGITITYALHPTNEIIKLKRQVELWRAEKAKRTTENRKAGAKKAAKTRVVNENIRMSARQMLDDLAREAAKSVSSPLAVPVVKLATYTTMCSRWAKDFQLRDNHEKKEKFYDLKDQALRILVEQPWTKVSFVMAPNSRFQATLCEDHFDEFREDRRDLGVSVGLWIDESRHLIRKCKSCTYSEDYDYYSLYLIETIIGEAKFSWHVPYPIGKFWLPPKNDLLKSPFTGNSDGIFMYGRPIDYDETIAWPEAKLVQEIERMFALFQK